MFLGNRLKSRYTLGNRLNGVIGTIGSYITPENIERGVKLGIQLHKSHSDIECYRNKTHD